MKKVVVAGLLAGVVIFIFGFLFTPLLNLVFPEIQNEYLAPGVFRPWSDPIMSLYYLYPFLLGIVLAWAWKNTHKFFSGRTDFEKARDFALAYFVVAGIPGMFITYSTFQVSLSMILAWSISGLLDAFIAGWIYTKKMK